MVGRYSLSARLSNSLAVRGGGRLDAATAALIARMSSAPDATRQGHIDKLVRDLKSAGIWTKLDVLYVLAAHDAQAARLNWKADAYNLTAVNSPTFTVDEGYAGDGSTSYLDTGWDPTNNAGNFTLNSATILGWSRTDGVSSSYWIGTQTSSLVRVCPRFTGDAVASRINDATSQFIANANGVGLIGITRSAAAVTQTYRNGAALGAAGSTSSTALPSEDFSIGKASNNFNPAQCAVFLTGGALNGTEHAALYTALNTYLTAVGAA